MLNAHKRELEKSNGKGKSTSQRPNQPVPAAVELPAEPPALAYEADILAKFAEDIANGGLAGETRSAKLLYLSFTSSFWPVANFQIPIVPRAESSTGKTHLTDSVAAYFPPLVFEIVSSMSPKALAYHFGEGQLSRRTLYVREASGMLEGDGASMLRMLMTDGYYDHRTVINGEPVHLHIDGPVNVVTTTTMFAFDKELETRVWKISLDESPEQTKNVMNAHSDRAAGVGRHHKLTPWRHEELTPSR